MNKNKNENQIRQNTINNIEENRKGNELQLNSEEPENRLNKIDSQNLNNNIQLTFLDEKNVLFHGFTKRKKKRMKKINNNLSIENEKQKNKIFKVNYRNFHSCHSKDDIIQSIINNFINFLVKFSNDVIFKKLKRKDMLNNISHIIKSKIKIKHILLLTVEQILTFKCKNIIDNKNEEQIREIKIIDSSLKKLFETHAIKLFKDIYYNTNKIKQIDLKKYEIEGIIYEINEEIPTYEKLKEKYKDNKRKVVIMDKVIKRFVKPQKFKITKKK